MDLHQFDYPLPPELIAQHPLPHRDDSRLLIYERATGHITHTVFRELPRYLAPTDKLVFNNSKVLPARLYGTIQGKPGEVLLLHPVTDGWEALVKPGRAFKPGTQITFAPDFSATVLGPTASGRLLQFSVPPAAVLPYLDRYGILPTPPYITEQLADPSRYQTVYAQPLGSVAAPTAGLHFTPELLRELAPQHILGEVTLHVGLGTFQPVQTTDLTQHPMHAEWFELTPELAEAINQHHAQGGSVVAVGTTTCRVLESSATPAGLVTPQQRTTDIFIYPGYQWRAVDKLITNFHLPKSTLLMLVSSFLGSREQALALYHLAIEEQYRFFSFGDAMFIV